MKQNLLDRLLARQRKLMGELDAPPTPQLAASTKPIPARLPPLASEIQDLAAAEKALLEGKHAQVRSLLKVHAERAGQPRTYLLLAQIEVHEGRFAEAELLLNRAERIDPNDQSVWSACADLHRSTRRFDREFPYRRRLAYTTHDAPADRYISLMRSLIAAAPKFKGPAATEIELLANKILGTEGVSPKFMIEAAEAMFNTNASVDKAAAALARIDPPQQGERDVIARWSYFAPWCAANNVELQRLNDEGVTGRRPTLATLSEALIHSKLQWAPVLEAGRTIINGMASTPWPKRRDDSTSPLVMTGLAGVMLRIADKTPRIDKRCLLIGGDGTLYRDLIEYASALAITEHLNVPRDLPLLVSNRASSHLLEVLTLLGYGGNELVTADPSQWTSVAQLTVTSRLTRGTEWVDPLIPRWYRRKLAALASTGNRRIMLIPSNSDLIERDQELEAWAADKGFVIMDPEQWTAAQAIEIFSSAQVVVSPLHPSLTYVAFMPPGATLCPIVLPPMLAAAAQLPFKALCEAADVRFAPVGSVVAEPQPSREHPKLRVDCAALSSALMTI